MTAGGTRITATLRAALPKLVLSPSLLLLAVFVYGFIAFTIYLSCTASKILPVPELVGFDNYLKLFQTRAWTIALRNLAVFGTLYVGGGIALGLGLAILLDQRIRAEGWLRPIYLYPMALSFIVTGTFWKWFLDPGIGLERALRLLGWDGFSFGWIKDPERAIYTVVIAALWHTSGFVMALFLAGLRGLDDSVLRAARIDGAAGPRLYWHIVLPQLKPVFAAAFVILLHMAIKSYDLVIALTGGGPGRATELPATFMYSYTFSRNQMAIGASAAVIMLMTVTAVIVPYLYGTYRERPHG